MLNRIKISAKSNKIENEGAVCRFRIHTTVFPHTVSAETILFLIWKLQPIQIVAAIFHFLLNKLNFCCRNYSRVETIQGQKQYKEIWYDKYAET